MQVLSTEALERFVEVACCPICRANLTLSDDHLELFCSMHAEHVYSARERGYFAFADKRTRDMYDEEETVHEYAAYAYGFRLINTSDHGFIGTGESEGLYRCVSQMVLASVVESQLPFAQAQPRVLDMACGVGRCVADAATLLPEALVIGLDYSAEMIKYASNILLTTGQIQVDLNKFGFGSPHMYGYGLKNAILAQADASCLPIRPFSGDTGPGFDIVINSMLIDRIPDPRRILSSVQQGIGVLKMGGTFILACPFNWISTESWAAYGRGRSSIVQYVTNAGIEVIEAFDGLVYRERMDPHGTHLDLPVLMLRGRRR